MQKRAIYLNFMAPFILTVQNGQSHRGRNINGYSGVGKWRGRLGVTINGVFRASLGGDEDVLTLTVVMTVQLCGHNQKSLRYTRQRSKLYGTCTNCISEVRLKDFIT